MILFLIHFIDSYIHKFHYHGNDVIFSNIVNFLKISPSLTFWLLGIFIILFISVLYVLSKKKDIFFTMIFFLSFLEIPHVLNGLNSETYIGSITALLIVVYSFFVLIYLFIKNKKAINKA